MHLHLVELEVVVGALFVLGKVAASQVGIVVVVVVALVVLAVLILLFVVFVVVVATVVVVGIVGKVGTEVAFGVGIVVAFEAGIAVVVQIQVGIEAVAETVVAPVLFAVVEALVLCLLGFTRNIQILLSETFWQKAHLKRVATLGISTLLLQKLQYDL